MNRYAALLFFIISINISASFSQNEHFTQLNTNHGLSINTTKNITQDYLGFIWIATRDGICKYDGSSIKTYKNSKDHLFSFGNNEVTDVFEDSNQTLWISTARGGIAKYDREHDKFINYNTINKTSISNIHINCITEINNKVLVLGTASGLSYFDLNRSIYFTPKNTPKLGKENIQSIYSDSKNHLWIGSLKNGAEEFDLQEGSLNHYSPLSSSPTYKISGNSIKCIIEDQQSNIWLGTWGNGLNKISGNGIKIFTHNEHDISTISQNAIFDLAISTSGDLWVATEDEGINKYVQGDESFHHIRHSSGDQRSLSDNSTECLFIDDHENIWVGTFSHGISILPKNPSPFKHIKSIDGNENSLSNNNIISVLKDSKNRLWIGTDGGGLNLLKEGKLGFTVFKHNPEKRNSIGANAILEIFEDLEGTIWVGTYRGGLCRYNEDSQSFTVFKKSTHDTSSISNNIVSHMFEDSDGNFWVSTWRNGFNLFHKTTGSFTRFPFDKNNPNGIPNFQVNHMIEGNNNDLWIASEEGIINFNKTNLKFKQYKKGLNSQNTINDDAASSLFLDKSNNLWIGTRGGGLNCLNIRTEQFSSYNSHDGFESDIIYHIIPETQTKLWISTNAGISEFDTETKKIKNHGLSEGVLGTQFVTGSGFIDKSGTIYLGSTEGLNFFNPKDIFITPQSSKLNFTDLKVFNKSINYTTASEIDKHISLAKKITLNYNQAAFCIYFSYLNFIHPGKTRYQYRLEGFDQKWVNVNNQNFATYTNLDPGTYLFEVKAFNESDNTVIDPISIEVEITPPFFMTLWFKALIILFFGIIIYSIFMIRVKAINDSRKLLKKHNLRLESEINDRKKTELLYKGEKEKAEKAAEIKDEFLSNMSHEIRTPLNMILGYLQLINTNKNNIDEFLRVMRISADNLLQLVNQILDLSKIEKGKLDINIIPFNTDKYLNEIKHIFSESIHSKGLLFNTEQDNDLPEIINGDKHRVNQILTNLLSNALKFTDKGSITLKTQLVNHIGNNCVLRFIVEDTGIGIAPSKLNTVFEKFTQEKSDITRKFGGTGLGLTIVKELCTLLKGQVEVTSVQSKGTKFTVTLPFKTEVKDKKDSSPSTGKTTKSIKGIKVLVVDDNQFNLTLSQTILEANQAIADTAISGKDALEMLDYKQYDAILMDIHMPETNGYQVVEEIRRRNNKTAVIGCTADIFEETFEKAIQYGMSDVITKPFEIEDLIDKLYLYTK